MEQYLCSRQQEQCLSRPHGGPGPFGIGDTLTLSRTARTHGTLLSRKSLRQQTHWARRCARATELGWKAAPRAAQLLRHCAACSLETWPTGLPRHSFLQVSSNYAWPTSATLQFHSELFRVRHCSDFYFYFWTTWKITFFASFCCFKSLRIFRTCSQFHFWSWCLVYADKARLIFERETVELSVGPRYRRSKSPQPPGRLYTCPLRALEAPVPV